MLKGSVGRMMAGLCCYGGKMAWASRHFVDRSGGEHATILTDTSMPLYFLPSMGRD